MDGVFGDKKRSFSKMPSRVDIFKSTVFMFSCRWVKTELLEKADILVSICYISEHALASLGITHCFLLSKFECRISLSNIEFHYRISSFECHSIFHVHGDNFENAPRVDADLFIDG